MAFNVNPSLLLESQQAENEVKPTGLLTETVSTDHYMHDVFAYNDKMHRIGVDLECSYYRALTECAMNNSMVISEGILHDIKEGIIKAINAIIEFIKKIIGKITGNSRESSKNYERARQESSGWTKGVDRDKAHNFTIYHYPENADGSIVLPCIREVLVRLQDLCNGKPPVDQEVNIEAEMKMPLKALSRLLKPERKTFSGDKSTVDGFKSFVNTDMIFTEKKEMTAGEWIDKYANNIPRNIGRPDFASNAMKVAKDQLEKCKAELQRSSASMTPDAVKQANIYLTVIKSVVDLWAWYVNSVSGAHNRNINNIRNTYSRLRSGSYDEGAMLESGTIHGEPFNSDTLFDNGDMRDFNPSEWTNLQLTAECYAIKFEMDESKRRMALQEALILTDDKPNKVARILAMQEAEGNRLANAVKSIIDKIKELINNFINKIKGKFDGNRKFIERNMDAIKKPFNPDMTVKSNGDILAGMYRIQEKITFKPFNFEQMKADLESKEIFFDKQIRPSLNGSSNFSKRNVTWQDGMSVVDFCKAYYGASMPEDKFKPCEFNGNELEQNKENMLKLLQDAAFLNSLKTDVSSVEAEAKKASAASAATGSIGGEGQNNSGSSESETKQECFSVLFDTVLKEAEVDMGEQSKEGSGENQKSANESGAFNVYVNAYKDVLTSKVTAAEFIVHELMQIIKAHANSNMSNEQKKAEAQQAKQDQQQNNQ